MEEVKKNVCYRKYKNPCAPDIWHQQQNNNNHNNDEKLFILDFLLLASLKGSHLFRSPNRTSEHSDSSVACCTAGRIARTSNFSSIGTQGRSCR